MTIVQKSFPWNNPVQFKSFAPGGNNLPIRDVIFSLERLEQHAQELAASQSLLPDSRRGRGLSRRVRENARVLTEAYRSIVAAIRLERPITPAAEWLVDNFFVVDEQLREIVKDLPSGFYKKLPKLQNGSLERYPRIFGLAWEFVAHTDSHFDLDALTRFIAAYQQTTTLEIGELWALPITLRIVMLENLRRLSERVVAARAWREEADAFSDELLGLNGRLAQPLWVMFKRLERRELPRPFVVQLIQRMRDKGETAYQMIRLLEPRLVALGTTSDETVHEEYQSQTASSVTVRNIITSMRLISNIDWADFFESVSLVDTVLRQNPVFSASDFATRDRYRQAVEELARGCDYSEVRVAEHALELASGLHPSHDALKNEQAELKRFKDPGYYLISGGRHLLERTLKYKLPISTWWLRTYLPATMLWYVSAIAGISVLLLALGFLALQPEVGLLERVLLGLLLLIPASDLGIALVNSYVTASLRPRTLPKLELKSGVPNALRTVVAVPTLFTSPAQILEEFEQLEVRYLSNSDGEVYFALLSDFTDAKQQVMPGDAGLLEVAVQAVNALNARYQLPLEPGQDSGSARFFLFHRERRWSETEQTFMGWERKRGKLHEFNRLLRGASNTSFIPLATPKLPESVRFVITLDADTRLPRGSVKRLVGAMAHPLNRPRFDDATNRVVEGYAVLQPRITLSLPIEREGTLFQRVFSSHAGMDPYASAVSDVYQDLFNEGSFAGKGIYDVDAFERAMQGRVPESTLLSHDLFEGLFARAGLLSDVELVEEYPSHYGVHAARQHRWVRGDWQLLPWIFSQKAPIMALGRWKLLDNLRRSLLPIAFLSLLVAGWLTPGINAGVWTGFLLGVLAFPALMPFLTALRPPNWGVSRRSYFLSLREKLSLSVLQLALNLTLLADQAFLMLDAIGRTLWRVLVSRKSLLEWRTAAQAKSGATLELGGFYRAMIAAPVLAVLIEMLVLGLRPSVWMFALPFLVVWAVSPIVAYLASLPRTKTELDQLPASDQVFLRDVARRTWRYFERFVGPDDHYLAPDNFQENPQAKIAHRTSPTNVGLALLSTVCAHDFGWIGRFETIERLELSFDSIEKLELFRGHLFNWYDTQSLQPLEPRYVSTVDSGNLAGHLVALAQSCFELTTQPLLGVWVLEGLRDALRQARKAAVQLEKNLPSFVAKPSLDVLSQLEETLADLPLDINQWAVKLEVLDSLSTGLVTSLETQLGSTTNQNPDITELLYWTRAIQASSRSQRRDVSMLMPWATQTFIDSGLTGLSLSSLLERSDLIRQELVVLPASSSLLELFNQGVRQATNLMARLEKMAARSEALFAQMDFKFLFDDVKKLFSIGFDVSNHRLDPSFYDLLASEARLTSFIAIAKDEVPTSHWFHLGRELTPIGRGTALVSWTGSMFEYLMPRLVMHAPKGSLLEETSDLVVRGQIAYGARRSSPFQTVPWGVSESAFAARDLALNYQYSAFGVPGLGLKRGLGDDLVIAPYASALAAMVNPVAASKNLRQLEVMGASGTYGFYDALDFTASRIPEGRRFLRVQNFMAHHSGMTLVALANVLLEDRMVKRFHADLRVQSAELLLQERTPRDATVDRPRSEAVSVTLPTVDPSLPGERSFRSIRDSSGQTHLLSNGRYTVMLTVAGAGFSRWNDLAVTRWREDATKDLDGSYLFVRALPETSRSSLETDDEARVFSSTPQPFGLEPEHFEARFFEDRAEFLRRDGVFESKLEVIVSPEDDAELRRLTITNHDSRARTLEITSYSEVVLTQPATDDAHPAFAKLFVQTEFVPGIGALLATRRPRSIEEPRVWAAHLAALEEIRLENGKLDVSEMDLHSLNPPQFETDRSQFLGRGRDIRQAQAVLREGRLSGSVGAVLDPIFSLRHAVRLQPGATARITFNTLIAGTREAVLEMADRYRDQKSFDRGLTLAWTRAQVELHFLGIAPDETHTFQRLASNALYLNKSLRASNEVLLQNTLGQSGLWRHGISGDLPIVLVRIDDATDLEIVRQLLRAHEYWRAKRVKIDLVILNEQATSYMQELQDAIGGLVRSSQMTARSEYAANGSVYTLRADLLSSSEHVQLRSVARAVLLSHQGSLRDQVVRTPTLAPLAASPRSLIPRTVSSAFSNLGLRLSRRPVGLPRSNLVRRPDLEFFNGYGGFSPDGLEYVIVLHEDLWTPAPWINVIANPNIGFTVSELGAGYTWTQNSRENKLTPWSNDPVSDPVGEVIYVRDEESFEVFSATPLPTREFGNTYTVRHGQGYSTFAHETHGLQLELTQFVPIDDPVKLSRLIIENKSGKPRKLSITAYLEWVLGVRREASAPYIITEQDEQTKALFARNPWSEEFANRTAFADLMVQWQAGKTMRFTCDRTEFIGRHGSLEHPAALQAGAKLSGRAGAGFDPCAALQTSIDLGINERIEVVFVLGETETRESATRLIEQYRRSDIGAMLELVKRHWRQTLELVQVSTPDHAMNLMLNRWLPYQTLSSRIYARTGFYQAGGAFGFRDQLQDTMALAGIKPDLARAQILRAASRQFLEGDVQHWWHPPSGRGVRTRISDDLIWLPYAVSHYLEVTGDTSILDETVNFIEGERLLPGHEDSYFNPAVSGLQATVFEHSARALDYSLSLGVHGLPLIGSGDWNDGMNRIGREGKGESVWLAWFLHTNLQAWAQLAESRNETDRARVWIEHAFKLKTSLEAQAWDGAWYKRAFYDDGTPLGSSINDECQIDSIAQSWAVISGAGDPTRAASAMQSVNQHLVKTEPGMVLLFDPPFENTEHDPGYIKGYLPGVRENGGQYTHAAVWSVIAFAMLGNGNKAFELFSMLNPINHNHTKSDVERYKVEPYVLAADVYGTPPNLGRGGWTWYTGSSGWMYRAGLESILGLLRRGNTVTIKPCIPENWSEYQINIMFGSSRFEIKIQNPQHVSTGVKLLELDGKAQPDSSFGLVDDGLPHQVRVVLGS